MFLCYAERTRNQLFCLISKWIDFSFLNKIYIYICFGYKHSIDMSETKFSKGAQRVIKSTECIGEPFLSHRGKSKEYFLRWGDVFCFYTTEVGERKRRSKEELGKCHHHPNPSSLVWPSNPKAVGKVKVVRGEKLRASGFVAAYKLH